MDLWTEFEGATIDRAFSLTKLLQTEGRSAFFSTLNDKGEDVLIRIIECHFDEDEILARWRGVQSLGHPNFLRIDRFGQFHVEDDATVAVYAVFERVDANLGEVLDRGHLSAVDAADIGRSVASALQALHASGFVHEHIEPRNIYAVAYQVKLRSDCIRETPEGEAGIQARRRDIYGLANVLSQVLLGAPRGSSTSRSTALPAPFDEIVRNGMIGNWGLAEIQAAFDRLDLPRPEYRKTIPPDPPPARPAPSAPKIAAPAASPAPRDIPALASSANGSAKHIPSPAPPASPASRSAALSGPPLSKPGPLEELPVVFGISQHDFRKWTTAAALFLAVVLTGWILLHHWFDHSDVAAQPDSAPSATTAPPAASPSPAPRASAAAPAPAAPAQSKVEWRVVAFTYNRQDQAQKKASSLAQQHPALFPAIFSPTGKAPWLVTIGGPLQRDAAYALARKARGLGLPRDTYAQNYKMR